MGSKIWTESVDPVLAFVEAQSLTPHYLLETHAHADHLSGSQMIKEKYPSATVAISEKITDVQSVFVLPADFATDGRPVHQLLVDRRGHSCWRAPSVTRLSRPRRCSSRACR